MGLYDRDYSQANFQSGYRYAPQMRMTFPKITPVVKKLLIINIAVFFATIVIRPLGDFLFTWCSVYPASLAMSLQLWRLITYQFLHGGIGHILFNMLGLFFLGPTLERYWGGRKFLIFYLGCGVAGGIFYPLLVAVNFLAVGPMVGASGAILGMLVACAILFPHFIIFFLFFPVPIRVASIILTFFYIANLLMRGQNAGGDAAHLAGMAAGALYVFSQAWRAKVKLKIRSGQWERKMAEEQNLQVELDRILQKVHDFGIHNLTPKEKKTLERATEAQQKRNQQ
jgi:membrane associated rhomboid family serine protease